MSPRMPPAGAGNASSVHHYSVCMVRFFFVLVSPAVGVLSGQHRNGGSFERPRRGFQSMAAKALVNTPILVTRGGPLVVFIVVCR